MAKRFLLLSAIVFSLTLNAQISESQKIDLKDDARIKLRTFMNYIQIIGSRGDKDGQPIYDIESKEMAIQRALKLFKDDAMMEVSSYNRNSSNFYTIKEYLYRLKNSLNYDQVNITFQAQALYFNENNLVKVPNAKEETYVGTITVVQIFEASRSVEGEMMVQYKDEVKKNVEIIIKKLEDSTGQHWRVILGDVSVTETKKI